jgi:hypothetical protein
LVIYVTKMRERERERTGWHSFFKMRRMSEMFSNQVATNLPPRNNLSSTFYQFFLLYCSAAYIAVCHVQPKAIWYDVVECVSETYQNNVSNVSALTFLVVRFFSRSSCSCFWPYDNFNLKARGTSRDGKNQGLSTLNFFI